MKYSLKFILHFFFALFFLCNSNLAIANTSAPLSDCANEQKFIESNLDKRSSYLALIRHLCAWKDFSAALKNSGAKKARVEEVEIFTLLWNQVKLGVFSQIPLPSDYRALGLAKNEYYKIQGENAPVLTLEPAFALESYVSHPRFNIEQTSSFTFILKYIDE